MDPSAVICRSYDTLKEVPSSISTPLNEYSSNQETSITCNPEFIPFDSDLSIEYYSPELYQKVLTASSTHVDIFQHLQFSTFENIASIKLANIDAVSHVSGTIFTFEKKQSNSPFTFIDLSDGEFVPYLQYRYPNSLGYGLSLNPKTKIDATRFTSYAGNIDTDWRTFFEVILTNQPNGVNFVIAGTSEMDDREGKSNFRSLLSSSIIGVACTASGGNFVLKIGETGTRPTAQLLYLLSQAFESISLLHPISASSESEQYVICKSRKVDVNPVLIPLCCAAEMFQPGYTFSSLFSEAILEDFELWLRSQNDLNLSHRLSSPSSYNWSKFLIIWNLPF